MTKQELDILGYTYTNITSGYVGVNYSALVGAEESFISEVLDTLKPTITEANLIDIIIGLDENGIPTGQSEKKITEVDKAQLPDLFLKEHVEKTFRIDHAIKNIGIYETDYIGYAYLYGNEMQKKSKAGHARAASLDEKMQTIVNCGSIQTKDLEKLAASYTKISSIDDISICVYQTYPRKDSSILYHFDRHGLSSRTKYNAGVITDSQIYKENSLTETTYHDGLAVRTQETITGLHGVSEVVVTTPTYEGRNIVKSKTTYSRRLAEGFQPICHVHRFYNEAGELSKVKISDAKYGKKSYQLHEKGFETEENGNVISYAGQVAVSNPEDPMLALRELLQLEGALMQLKSVVPEYELDYQPILREIYTQKVNYALAAIKEEKALLYIADKGNMTIYDNDYKKAVYFPVAIIKQYLPTYRNYPNVIVEQKIKEGSDPEAIRRLFEFGTHTEGPDAVYAFHRVVKALSKNKATPSDVLRKIVEGIYDGKYDNSNLITISSNPNTDTETLQIIIDHKPTLLVKSHIEENPNRPKILKAQTSTEKAKKMADSILNS